MIIAKGMENNQCIRKGKEIPCFYNQCSSNRNRKDRTATVTKHLTLTASKDKSTEAGDIGQWVKHLPNRRKDLSSNPLSLHKVGTVAESILSAQEPLAWHRTIVRTNYSPQMCTYTHRGVGGRSLKPREEKHYSNHKAILLDKNVQKELWSH